MCTIFKDELGYPYRVIQQNDSYIIQSGYLGRYSGIWKTALSLNYTPLDFFETRARAEQYLMHNIERIL